MTTEVTYGSWTAITWSMAIAEDANLLVGRESTLVDNTTNKFMDAVVGGTLTGPSSGAAAGRIEIYLWGNAYGLTSYPSDIAGTDGALTLVAETKFLLTRAATIITNATNGEVYKWGSVSVRDKLGWMPQKWGLWAAHSAGGTLQSPSTQYLGIQYTDA